MGHARRSPRGRRWRCLSVVIAGLALVSACGSPEPRGQFGPSASAPSAQSTYNPLTPAVPLTVEQAEQQLSFQLLAPATLPAGLFLQQLNAFPDEDAATFSYATASGTAGFQVTERSRAWTTADAFWPPHATLAQSNLLFGAQSVTRYVAGWEGCGNVTEYVWEQTGVSVAVTSYADDADQQLVEQFIAATVGAASEAIVAPTATPTTAAPQRTPFGEYCDLSAAQAVALAPFALRLPAPPAPLAITRVQLYNAPSGLEARASPPATVAPNDSVTLNAASALITASDTSIELYERTGEDYFGGPPPIGERSTITLGSVDVTRESYTTLVSDSVPSEIQVLRYDWQQGGLTCHLNATLAIGGDASVSQADVDQLIATIIAGN